MKHVSTLSVAVLLVLGEHAAAQDMEFAGSLGVVASTVVDPIFVIEETGGSKQVTQALHAQDENTISVVPFAHVAGPIRGSEVHNWAFSFGGTDASTDDLNLFAGISYHFGHSFYVTIGRNWRSVPTLPAEQKLNHAPLRDDILTNLPTRTEQGYFLAWTYALIGRNDSPTSPTRRYGPDHVLTLYDDDRNGTITCAEARNHDLVPPPVPANHPAYEYMIDANNNGEVCE